VAVREEIDRPNSFSSTMSYMHKLS
jgi:hypothetical protein